MESVLALPAREPLLPGESLTSLVRRTAQAMGYEGFGQMRSLLGRRGELPAHLNHLTPGTTLDRLARMLLLPAQLLFRGTVHDYARQLMLVPHQSPPATECDSATILRCFISSHPPVCPRCLAEDERPYERLAWSLRAMPVCLRHDCYLICRCPECSRMLRPDRPTVSECSCSFDVRKAPPILVSAAALATYPLMGCWHQGEATPLSEPATCASLWWLERLASAAAKTPDWLERIKRELQLDPEMPPESISWLAAARILAHWPERLCEFLGEFQKVSKFRTTETGVTRRFGLLLREAKHLEDFGYSSPAEALRQYLTEHYTDGSLSTKVCLFDTPQHGKLLLQRPWITPTEADDLLRARSGTAADLVGRGKLTGHLRPVGRRGRLTGVISRESVQDFQREMATSLTVCKTCQHLGLGRSCVYELIKAGLLPGALRAGGRWRISRVSVDALLGHYRNLPAIERPSPQWPTARDATRQFGPSGLTLDRLLMLILDGRISAKRLNGLENLRGLCVSEPDLLATLPAIRQLRDQQQGISLSRLARTLFPRRPMKEPALKKWIAAGLLQAKRVGRSWRVAPEEIDRFRRTYCLFNEAADLLGVSRSTLARWEAEGRIVAVYGRRTKARGGFSLYYRDAVERLRIRRACRPVSSSNPT